MSTKNNKRKRRKIKASKNEGGPILNLKNPHIFFKQIGIKQLGKPGERFTIGICV